MTSTPRRNYNYLVESVKRLKQENYNFEIIITGRTTAFNQKRIPTNLINNFKFKQKISYSELYKLIDNSDYIIILIDLSNKYGKEYKTIKVSGSIQLTYGFLKPALIHKEFSEFYRKFPSSLRGITLNILVGQKLYVIQKMVTELYHSFQN